MSELTPPPPMPGDVSLQYPQNTEDNGPKATASFHTLKCSVNNYILRITEISTFWRVGGGGGANANSLDAVLNVAIILSNAQLVCADWNISTRYITPRSSEKLGLTNRFSARSAKVLHNSNTRQLWAATCKLFKPSKYKCRLNKKIITDKFSPYLTGNAATG
jgi:hypothetical protein